MCTRGSVCCVTDYNLIHEEEVGWCTTSWAAPRLHGQILQVITGLNGLLGLFLHLTGILNFFIHDQPNFDTADHCTPRHRVPDKMIFTVTSLQVIRDVSVKVSTQAAGSAHKLWAELDVNGATAPLPGQREAMLLCHQNILWDLLQLQVVDVMRELQAERRHSVYTRKTLITWGFAYKDVLVSCIALLTFGLWRSHWWRAAEPHPPMGGRRWRIAGRCKARSYIQGHCGPANIQMMGETNRDVH